MKSFKKLISLALSAVMLAATLPMSAMAAAETKSVVEDIDWENWLITDAIWSSHLDNSTYYVDNGWWCANAMGDGKFSLEINDTGAESHAISATTGHSSDGKNWGFKGTKYYTGWLGEAEGARVNEFPTDRWLGVKDISAHKDTGYAVFTIGNVTGDAENAYLAIKTAPMDWDIEELVHRMLGNALVDAGDTNAFPITPERYPVRDANQPFKEFYNTKVTGVKLTDYYNMAKGGTQTVAVPLSKLATAPDFNEVFSTNVGQGADVFESKRNTPLDLRLFAGMGIARKNSGQGKTFSAAVTDLAIVDPKTPENMIIEQDGENIVIVFDTTTDTDVAFKVKKTCNGIVEYIDAPEGVAEDVIDTSKSYMYQAVAVNEAYGVEAVSEPYFIGSAGVEILKAEMNWRDYVGLGGDAWHNYMEGERYYIGELSIFNNSLMKGYDYCMGNDMSIKIDDNAAGTEYGIAKEMYVDGANKTEIPTVGGFWGFKGANYNILRDYADKTKIPDDIWFGIKNLKDYEETGYAVFTISSVTGDAENAYLAITTLSDQWQLPEWAWDAQLPITKADYADKDWNFEHGMTVVSGVKLTDYYDVAKGGVQTVAVPLSKLVYEPDFEELKSQSSQQIIDKMSREDFEFTKAELYLFTGMGIARRDSLSNKTFAATVAGMKIVGLQVPQNLVGTEKADGSVSFSFETTSDIGVEYKIARTTGGVTEYFDAPGGAFTDTNIDPKKEYVYTAVAYDPELKIYSKGSNEYVKGPKLESVVRADMDWKNWIDSWFNYLEDETYFYGTPGIYNDYNGHTYYAGGDMPVSIDDIGAGTAKSIATQMYKDGALTEIPNIDGFWAFTGLNYNKMRAMADKSNVPADRWFGVKTLKAYKDTGYVSFTIDNVSGDAENAYFAITTLPNANQIPAFALDGEVALPITKADNEAKVWAAGDEHYVSVVTGVKLTDYYDMSKGGEQTVMIPLAEFVDAPEFMEFRAKDYNSIANHITEEALANFVPELHLFTGMGIAKRDSGAANKFSATVKAAKVVAVNAPSNVAATVNEDGSVTVTFDKTMDKDVAFKVKRTSGSEVVYFDAADGVYTDTTRDADKTYTYSVVAASSEYGIEAESADSATVEREVVNYAKLFAGNVETKYVKEGTMTAKFFASDADSTGYIAKYDAEGRLTGANLVSVPAGEEKEASLDVAITDIVKVMLWADAEPIAELIVAAEKPVKVLYIGDEAVLEGAEYIDELATADGIKMEVASVYYSGAAISNHLTNIENASAKYTVSVNGAVEAENAVLSEIIAGEEWDKILVQEDIEKVVAGNGYAGFAELVAAIGELSTADVVVVDGWCGNASFDDDIATVLDSSQTAAAEAEVAIYSTAMAALYLYDSIELWNANGTGLGDAGKYMASLLIYKNIAQDNDIMENTFAPAGVEKIDLIKEKVAGV